jgi:hypothetical protein
VKIFRRSGFTLAGFVAGIVAGSLIWTGVRHGYRGRLFSRNPLERFVALTYLAAYPTLETARVLGDYVRWEKTALLRKQGARLLRTVEGRLGAHG